MKTKYLVIGISDTSMVKDAYLSSTGINKEEKHFVMGTYIDVVESFRDAANLAGKFCKSYEYGCEIKTIYTNE